MQVIERMKWGLLKPEEIVCISPKTTYNYITKAHEVIRVQSIDLKSGQQEAVEEFHFKRPSVDVFLFNSLLICQERDLDLIKIQIINLDTAEAEGGWDKEDLT